MDLELSLIVLKHLEGSEFEDVAKLFREKLATSINETRLDFKGDEHSIDLEQLLTRYPNLRSSTLKNICAQLKILKDKQLPSTSDKYTSLSTINSILGDGLFSILRDEKSLQKDQLNHSLQCLTITKHYLPAYQKQSLNIVHHIRANRTRAPVPTRRFMPPELFSNFNLYSKTMGHLSSAYCVCFDQTGRCIFTGADDFLVKIWSSTDGRLLKTLRGHDGHISDMSVSFDNRLLATAGLDKIIRIWDLKTTKLLECLVGHSATISSVKFSPYNRHETKHGRTDVRYLVSTSNDGSVIFWEYNIITLKFRKKDKYSERNRPGGQITCSSFSTGGSFLACGSSDNYIHIYGFHPHIGPYNLDELGVHRDKVDSVQFCNNGVRFVSGSKDGTAIIWTFKRGAWQPMILDMSDPNEQQIISRGPGARNQPPKPVVLIVQWSRDDRYVITSVIDYSIRIWDSTTGKLVHVLREHKHDVYLIESHPTDPRIFVSAGHDGALIIWDIERGKPMKKIQNSIVSHESQESTTHASIYDVKFSPDGTLLATTDSHGYLAIYGMGPEGLYSNIPEQMFFSTDYRPVIRDVRHFVMDEQTHIVPHLMPKPTLVDMNGNPYPREKQALVPDFKDSNVVPQLTDMQAKVISTVIEDHSFVEDEVFLHEKGKNTPNNQNRHDSSSYDDSATEIDSDATEIDSDTTEIAEQSNYIQRSRRYNTRRGGMRQESERGTGRPQTARRGGGATRYCTRSRTKRIRTQ